MAQQALSSTRRGYDLVADKFDQSVFRAPACILDSFETHLRQLGPYREGLDVGCGTGILCQVLARVCLQRVVGLDMSEGMLLKAHSQPYAPGPAVEFWQGDILELKSLERFDVATSIGMFGHILPQDHPRMLQSIHASLLPGGRFVCVLSHFPRKTRLLYWLALTFDSLMKVRNLLWKPEFVMYYLSFPLDRAEHLMKSIGLSVEIVSDVFPVPFTQLKLVVATKSPLKVLKNSAQDVELGTALVREYTQATAREMETTVEEIWPVIPDFHDFAAHYFPESVPESAFLVLYAGSERGLEPAGCVALSPAGQGRCEMNRLFVRPAFRRRGLARQLAQACLEEARKRGYSSMSLDVLTTRERAAALYRSLGFEPAPARHHYDFPVLSFEREL